MIGQFSSLRIDDLDEKTDTKSKINDKQKKKIEQIYIDEQWFCENVKISKNLLSCPICFYCIFDPVQCIKCQRLFCKEDYNNIKKINDYCPLCKNTPWTIKQQIHIAYRQLRQSLEYICHLCKDNTKMFSQTQLSDHLLKDHNTKIKQYRTKIYKYKLLGPTTAEDIQLDLYQNLQINDKQIKDVSKSTFKMLNNKLGEIVISLSDMKYSYKDSTGKKQSGKMQKKQVEKDDELNSQKSYVVWGFMSDKKQLSFYLKQHQKKIEQAYQIFKKKPAFSEVHICFEQSDCLYRIMFKQMVQVNLGTEYQRKIQRRIIKLS